MRMTTRPGAALALLSLLTACSGSPRPEASVRAGAGAEPSDDPAVDPLSHTLDAALARGSWEDLRVDAECQDEDFRLQSVKLFGTGVGIWNDTRQFAVPRERLLGVLEALRRAGFGSMRESHGGRDDAGKMGLELICRVRAVLDGVEKQSYQLSKGRQSAELRELAGQILAVGEDLGPSGVAAASLEEGLGKIARGELAPEALTLQLQRQAEDPRSTEGGWILRVEDGKAQLTFSSPETGWTDPRRVRLSREDLAGIARNLLEARPEELPANLYSSWYQDLEIRVLNHKKSLQARRFAGVTPETHGERQERFDRLVAALEDLEKRLGS
ncbi:MAG TPA: hypothetical protein VF179_32430 [Thermoanaerobaculia bacterium]|nr:hypothetical protein [Thermoanaerobaculia bacterium]